MALDQTRVMPGPILTMVQLAKLGADIDGEAASDNFGYAVSINDG